VKRSRRILDPFAALRVTVRVVIEFLHRSEKNTSPYERKCEPLGYTWDIQVKIFKYTLIAAAVFAGCSALFLEKPLPFIYALIFGTLIGILNFRNLALTLEKAVKMTPGQAQVYAGSRYFIRYMINGIVIFVSIKADYLNVFGAVLGLFLIKFVVVVTNLFNDINFFKRIFIRKEEE